MESGAGVYPLGLGLKKRPINFTRAVQVSIDTAMQPCEVREAWWLGIRVQSMYPIVMCLTPISIDGFLLSLVGSPCLLVGSYRQRVHVIKKWSAHGRVVFENERLFVVFV